MKGFRFVIAAAALAGSTVGFAQSQQTLPQVESKDLLSGLANASRWLLHSGDYASTRHSPLKQITPDNVGKLAPAWSFETGLGYGRQAKFEATPIAIDGILYVTGLYNNAWAIDGKTGTALWHYERQLTPALRVCCGMANRGFAVHGGRLYMGTLDAHVVALDIKTGKVVWDVPMIDYRLGYSSTAAPLIVKDKLIVGMAGGEFATRGFLDAYSLVDGKRLWRFNTIPAPGEPGGDTWPAGHFERGGGATWITGSYDPDLNVLYWGIGNPNPLFYGGNRKGDNLYTASVVALDPDTGKLRWHFQYTPHDEHDWDSNQIQVLADLTIGGKPRKTLVTANRNGFFYVLDRANGAFIQAKPYVTTTWATDVDAKGRPIELPNQRPTPSGTRTCPDLAGGSSFTSPSFDPVRRLFFVSARETCQVFVSYPPPENYQLGSMVMGGGSRNRGGSGVLRAIDPVTMQKKWEVPYGEPSYSGVLSTASGLVFAGDDGGTLMGVHADNGRVLWRAQLPGMFWGAPSTVMVDGRQLVLMPAGQTLTAFALPSSAR
ncbi:MAG TPA: PQQ-dependent dehydrogenase, methanol/ethanol family [Vicinamibacterales bacterium]|nr:PQQ-dependent dehydrogenase, methanol/ethanol family [Vicinamibacterales bacterium]